tara:strand:+ start:8325 stop:8456 length:132 start_codon:yes stop_codon:yes gene_type:complete
MAQAFCDEMPNSGATVAPADPAAYTTAMMAGFFIGIRISSPAL